MRQTNLPRWKVEIAAVIRKTAGAPYRWIAGQFRLARPASVLPSAGWVAAKRAERAGLVHSQAIHLTRRRNVQQADPVDCAPLLHGQGRPTRSLKMHHTFGEVCENPRAVRARSPSPPSRPDTERKPRSALRACSRSLPQREFRPRHRGRTRDGGDLEVQSDGQLFTSRLFCTHKARTS
jgi:hypothetical protein